MDPPGSSLNLMQLLEANLAKYEKTSERKVSPLSSTASEPASSLLDILIKTEQESEQIEEDPLEGIGNIGDDVINQMAGKTLRDVLGEGPVREDEETVNQNALKLFDEAMCYSKPTLPPKRRYTRYKSVHEQTSSLDPSSSAAITFQTISKQFQKKEEVKTQYPRANFNVPCVELFQNDKKPDEKFTILCAKVDEERNQQIANQVAKDVERLLASANKIYGQREWTAEEKKEFGKYCKSLKANRGLTMEDRLGIQNFYAKAYKLDQKTAARTSVMFYEEFRKANGMPPGLISPMPAPLPLKRKTNHKEEESVMYPKAEKITVKEEIIDEEEDEYEEEKRTSPGRFSLFPPPNPSNSPFTPFHPGMKYEKEKLFRNKVIGMFYDIFITIPKKRGRPKMLSRLAVPVEPEVVEEPEWPPPRNKDEDLKCLMGKFNVVMEEEKVWSQEDIEGLGRFYEMFKEKLSFTIIQSKELGNYLRKIFGRLEKYELERENDTNLQEKRKFWQEYKKNHATTRKVPERKAVVKRLTPVRPYIRSGIDFTGESEEQRKARKAAYLREWRMRRAEKQNVEFCSRLINSLPNMDGNNAAK